ncbi:MAG TPA: hypothetical protein VKV04_24880 [Verrucomicrobiae bacterium]|nr:hypothetical protein [Verrucomicrobiae bacterium]
MTQLYHITAAWSNAVLVALLPHFSDCAKQLNLPIPTPITISQVARFMPPIEADVFEVGLWLTNGYQFHYLNGAIAGFNSLHDDLYIQQDIDGLERFTGKDNMTTNEAINLARNSFVKLGYKLSDFHMDGPPTEFEVAPDTERYGHVPFCKVTWQNRSSPTNYYYLEFHVNMNQKRLLGMSLVGQKLWRPIPKVDATPELETDYQKQHPPGKMYSRTNAPPTRQ